MKKEIFETKGEIALILVVTLVLVLSSFVIISADGFGEGINLNLTINDSQMNSSNNNSQSQNFNLTVGYITKKKVNPQVMSVFNEMNMGVELIKDEDIPSKNLNSYNILFIDDVVLKNADKIYAQNHKVIIMNKRYGKEFGLTDRDGISQLSSNSELRLMKNSVIQAYQKSSVKIGKLGIPYYYLDNQNKLNKNMTSIASVYNGNQNTGDVVVLFNEENKKCFFGIAQTQYWTNDARELFKECVMFVNQANIQTPTIACSQNSDCGVDGFIGEGMCMTDGVYKDHKTYACNNPGTTESYCITETTHTLVESCSSCSNGMCNTQTHDVSIVENFSERNGIKILNTETGEEPMLNESLLCNQDYVISYRIVNKGNVAENITFSGMIGDLNWTQVVENIIPNNEFLFTKTINMSLVFGNYSLDVMSSIEGDSNPSDNEESTEITVIC